MASSHSACQKSFAMGRKAGKICRAVVSRLHNTAPSWLISGLHNGLLLALYSEKEEIPKSTVPDSVYSRQHIQRVISWGHLNCS